jgi:hypothetical protein
MDRESFIKRTKDFILSEFRERGEMPPFAIIYAEGAGRAAIVDPPQPFNDENKAAWYDTIRECVRTHIEDGCDADKITVVTSALAWAVTLPADAPEAARHVRPAESDARQEILLVSTETAQTIHIEFAAVRRCDDGVSLGNFSAQKQASKPIGAGVGFFP